MTGKTGTDAPTVVSYGTVKVDLVLTVLIPIEYMLELWMPRQVIIKPVQLVRENGI